MGFLEKIIREKQLSIEQEKKSKDSERVVMPSVKSRFKSILEKPGTHLIAEIKRASPSKGDLRPDLNIAEIARIYEQGGVELVSVLTEEKFFKGSLDDLDQVKNNTSLSILCKDFMLDSSQIRNAKAHGADAALLIARLLTTDKLKELLGTIRSFSMDAVVEVHNEADLKKIEPLIKDIEIIGINHRDLDDFSIDLGVTSRLLPKIPQGKIIIAESGFSSGSEIRRFKDLGVKGVLVGESLMKEKDIFRKIKEFSDALR